MVVLVSGSGTLLQALLDDAAAAGTGADTATDTGAPGQGGPGAAGRPYTVTGVISDRDDAHGLTRARAAGVATAVVRPGDFDDRATWDLAVAKAVEVFTPDLVVLAGFMRLLGDAYLTRFADRTINSHPALLPAFPGAHAVRDALAYGVRVTGTTVILLDAGVDSGPVVAQRAVEVLDGDDEARLHERIKVVERELLVEVVRRMTGEGWQVRGRRVRLGSPNTGAPNTGAPDTGAPDTGASDRAHSSGSEG